jgi:hypothetical protein
VVRVVVAAAIDEIELRIGLGRLVQQRRSVVMAAIDVLDRGR